MRTPPDLDKGNVPFLPEGSVNMKYLLSIARNRDTCSRRVSTYIAGRKPCIGAVNRDCKKKHLFIHLPGPLCSTDITRLLRSYGASDS